jgi:hypothetical protein
MAVLLLTGSWSPATWAYRPFDGTDADVAEEGTFELELAPVGYVHQPSYDALVVPSLVLNQGIDDDVELVLQISSRARSSKGRTIGQYGRSPRPTPRATPAWA